MTSPKERTDPETLSHNLLWLRRHHGYSQRAMAKLLKIGVGSLRRLEHGEIPEKLTIEFLYEVYAHFEVLPSELMEVWME